MTSPAIKLARECGAIFYPDQAICFGCKHLEAFYAKAQAQALRNAAEELGPAQPASLYPANHLRRIADELERKS